MKNTAKILAFFVFSLTIVVLSTYQAVAEPLKTDVLQRSIARSGLFTSPDKKYVVKYDRGDASIEDSFSLFRSGTIHKDHQLINSKQFYKINGFLWIPGQPHTLVFAVQRYSGSSYITLWNGIRTVRTIFRGDLPKGEEPDAEDLRLIGVTPDGKTVLCEHTRNWMYKNKEYSKEPMRIPLPPTSDVRAHTIK